MAKPIRIAGLLRRTPIARAASNVLRAVLLDLLEKVPEARSGGSKKGIHDLRVAVKRFRESSASSGRSCGRRRSASIASGSKT